MTYSRQELASLGKRASDLHRKQGMQLNDAVVKVASAERGLTPEHVTRITENANLITFEEMFKEADSKHVVFDLADPVEVVNTLQSPNEDQLRSSFEYNMPPVYDGDHGIDTFNRQPLEKESSYLDVNHEYEDTRQMIKLNSAINHINSELQRLDSEAQYATFLLADMVKKAALQCNAAYPVLQIMGTFAEDESIFEKVSTVVVSMLPSEIPRGEYVDLAPNPDHPIASQYLRVEDLTKEAARYYRGVEELKNKRNKEMSQARFLGADL